MIKAYSDFRALNLHAFFFVVVVLFWLCLQHVEVPGAVIKPEPQ